MTTYKPKISAGLPLKEADVVRNTGLSIISWEEAKAVEESPCYRITDLKIYDKHNHYVSLTKVSSLAEVD